MIYLVIDDIQIDEDSRIIVSEDEAKYLLRVRRLKEGAEVYFCSNGHEYRTELEMDGKEPRFKIMNKKERNNSSVNIIAAIAVTDINSVEESVRNGVEAGVDEFVFFRAQFSNMSVAQIEKRMKRIKTIVVSAASQSRRGHLPEVNISTIDDIAEMQAEHIVLHPYSPENIMEFKVNDNYDKVLWIGPEGGFSDEEFTFFQEKNFKIFSLKTPILRTENAVTFLSAFIKNITY